ncbi:MAG: C1 family peptidase, partial [Verrucomicrobiales bacterium]|nr:C1 family peptidase [Verrucomicrobiales bacterium]
LETPSAVPRPSRTDSLLDAATSIRESALALLGSSPATDLRVGRPGGALGCVVPDEVLRLFRAERRVSPLRAVPPQGFGEDALPDSVRLTPRLPVVRDQGSRGTCVAFATVALREFLEPESQRLSEQFLYWACKELDGRDAPGTTLHTAMSSLAQYGCCLEKSWPYDPAPRPNNESHRPPPRGALEDASRFRMPNCRTVEPSWVDQYRRILAGRNGAEPTPVVVGVLVFPSWFYSPATHRTGKITLPFPYEEPEGGHAMCVVGYVDDATAPGGGYFIVRNSWGPRWAHASPEAPGHALMPYAYFEAYALEAFTGPVLAPSECPATSGSNPAPEPDLRHHTRILTHELRDQDGPAGQGRLLRPGTAVLFHPLAPDEVKEDTESNRRLFLELDRAWTVATRQRVWFPPVATFSERTRALFDCVRANQDRFFAAIEDNLRGAVGTPFPYGHTPPWAFFVPWDWEPKTESVETAVDLTDTWVAELQRRSGARPDLPWPADWMSWLREHNRFLVLRLSRGSAQAHVVVVHLAPVTSARGEEPRLAEVSRALLDAVHQLYRTWSTASGVSSESPVFFTLALESPVPDHVEVPANGTLREILVSFRPDGTWTVPPPSQE